MAPGAEQEAAGHFAPSKSMTLLLKASRYTLRGLPLVFPLHCFISPWEACKFFGVGARFNVVVACAARFLRAKQVPLDVCAQPKTDCFFPCPLHSQIMDGFRKMGFPQCVGAVDGTHIKVRPPRGRGEEFVNRKSAFSILLQGTVDHSGRFVDIVLGYTGRTHDAFVFRHSSLWHAMEAGKFVPGNPTITIDGVTIGPVILGDAAYPLSRWLMKPYGGHLTRKKIAYNRVFNYCRNVVERAFGRLKARWGCLSAPLTVSEKNYLPVVSACVVLHNICESKGHLLHPVIQKPAPLTLARTERDSRPHDSARRIHEGELVRDAIANMIAGDCD